MKKPLLEIYSSLVCFVTVACFSVWLGVGLYALIGVLAPEITLDEWVYQRHQSNQQFYPPMLAEPFALGSPETLEINKPEPFKSLSDQEMAEKRRASYQFSLESEIRKNLQTLLKSLIAVFICVPLFFIHWRFVSLKQR